jgi:hypothetical protein
VPKLPLRYGKWPSRMEGQWFFLKSGGRAGIYMIFSNGRLPLAESTSPEKKFSENISVDSIGFLGIFLFFYFLILFHFGTN